MQFSFSMNELCDCAQYMHPSSSWPCGHISHRRELTFVNRPSSFPYYLESRQADRLCHYKTISITSILPSSTVIDKEGIDPPPSLKSSEISRLHPSIVVKDRESASALSSNNFFTATNHKEVFINVIDSSKSKRFKIQEGRQCSPIGRKKSLAFCNITNKAQSEGNLNRLKSADIISDSLENMELIASDNTWSTYSSILDALESLCAMPVFELSPKDIISFDDLATYNFITIYEICMGKTSFPISSYQISENVPTLTIVPLREVDQKESTHDNMRGFNSSVDKSSYPLSQETNNNNPRRASRRVLTTITNVVSRESFASRFNASLKFPRINKPLAPRIIIDCVDDITPPETIAHVSSIDTELFPYQNLSLLNVSWCPRTPSDDNELLKSDYSLSISGKDFGPNRNPWLFPLSCITSLEDLESQLEHHLLYPVEIKTKIRRGKKLHSRSVRTEEEFDKWIRGWGQKYNVVEVEVVQKQTFVHRSSIWKRLVSWA